MPNSQYISRSNAYRVLKVGAEFMTRREKKMLEKIKSADPESESLGSNLVRLPERIFDVVQGEQTYNCFVFEPLGPSLLDFINRPANKPLGVQRVRLTVALLLHALDFLHKNGIAHTGKQRRRKSP
jgi:serine/threonine-protein kinase SRPK3